MNSPNRIPQIIKKLKKLWVDNPDMRLGQLLYNVGAIGGSEKWPPFPELFYLEDNIFVERMNKFMSIMEIKYRSK